MSKLSSLLGQAVGLFLPASSPLFSVAEDPTKTSKDLVYDGHASDDVPAAQHSDVKEFAGKGALFLLAMAEKGLISFTDKVNLPVLDGPEEDHAKAGLKAIESGLIDVVEAFVNEGATPH